LKTTRPIFTSPQDVETAFYEALERADLDAMMAVWAEDEEVVCVHPGGPRITGYAAVREVWRRMFEAGSRLRIRLSEPTMVQNPFTAIQTVREQISVVGDEELRAPVIATNVYVRGALGWRLVLHHASPAPPAPASENPKTLH